MAESKKDLRAGSVVFLVLGFDVGSIKQKNKKY